MTGSRSSERGSGGPSEGPYPLFGGIDLVGREEGEGGTSIGCSFDFAIRSSEGWFV